MKIFKCDRCGDTYRQNKDKWNDPLINRITWNHQPKDLCDNCYNELQEWVANPQISSWKWSNEWNDFKCSKCGSISSVKYDYCPYCGARMIGE